LQPRGERSAEGAAEEDIGVFGMKNTPKPMRRTPCKPGHHSLSLPSCRRERLVSANMQMKKIRKVTGITGVEPNPEQVPVPEPAGLLLDNLAQVMCRVTMIIVITTAAWNLVGDVLRHDAGGGDNGVLFRDDQPPSMIAMTLIERRRRSSATRR